MEALRGWSLRDESALADFHELRQDLCEAPCKGSPTKQGTQRGGFSVAGKILKRASFARLFFFFFIAVDNPAG